MSVLSKSIYEEEAAGDGHRVLVTRYWPRGVARGKTAAYIPLLSPSRELLRSFKDRRITWDAFEAEYLRQMEGELERRAIMDLAQHAKRERVAVMCTCKDETQCHRRLLRTLIEEAMETVP